MSIQTQKARIILAIEAIRITKKLSCRKAAKIYNIPWSILNGRMNSRTDIRERRLFATKLIQLEEESLSLYILDLDSRGFALRLAGIENMANYFLKTRRRKRISKLWTYRFVQRRPELKTRFNCVYDFQRALCEDPVFIGRWFELVQNMRTKYKMLDCDFYNFDETGFIISVITPGIVVTHSD